MAGNGNRGGSSRSAGGKAAAAAPSRRMTPEMVNRAQGMINRGKKTLHKAGNLLDNIHQDTPTARSMRRVGLDRRMGLSQRMLQRQLSRGRALSSAQNAVDRSRLAEGYRMLRRTPAPVGGPKVAREMFRYRGRSVIPRGTR